MDLQAIPILLSPNIQETREFGEQLGFVVETVGDEYALFKGYGIELHYSVTSNPEACKETSCYVRGGGILDLHKLLSARPGANPTRIVHRPWGMTEFYLRDPHGNLIKFGMSTDEHPEGSTGEITHGPV